MNRQTFFKAILVLFVGGRIKKRPHRNKMTKDKPLYSVFIDRDGELKLDMQVYGGRVVKGNIHSTFVLSKIRKCFYVTSTFSRNHIPSALQFEAECIMKTFPWETGDIFTRISFDTYKEAFDFFDSIIIV